METVKVSKLIDTTSAVSPRKGLIAYESAASELRKGIPVQFDFSGIEDLTSAFCNAFIGKLYMDFGPKTMHSLFHIAGIAQSHVWQRKIDSAILLGTNENARKLHEKNLEEVIHS